MNKNLENSSKDYPASLTSRVVHPISSVDAQIMVEVIELFKKLGSTAAVDLLNSYKGRSDEDVLLDLYELNVNIGKYKNLDTVTEDIEDKEGKTKRVALRYLNTCGRRLDIWLIIGYDSLDIEGNDIINYCIRLNPTPESCVKVPFYSNELLIYKDVEERDSVLQSLDMYFELNRGLFLPK